MDNVEGTKTSNRLVSVGGGKGGVGKSLVSVNLAVALAQRGQRVVLVDLDLGAANLHLLLGLNQPRPGVQALMEGSVEDVRQTLTPTGVANLSLLAGTGATLGAANISHQTKRRLLRKLGALDATVVLDVGAGVGYNALDFFLLGGQKLLVLTPQVTSIHDAYSFLKSAVLRLLKQHAERSIDAALLEPALRSAETAKVSLLLDRLREQRPELAARVATLLRTFNVHLVGNQVNRPADAGIIASVARMMKDYLGVEIPVLGCLAAGAVVSDSVNERRPFVLGRPSEQGRTIHRLAETLSVEELGDDFELDIVDEDDEPVAEAAAAPVSSFRRRVTLPGMTPVQLVRRAS